MKILLIILLLTSTAFGGMAEIRAARNAGNMQQAIVEAKAFYPSATPRQKESIEEMMRSVYRRRAEQVMRDDIKVKGRVERRQAVRDLRTDGTGTFRIRPDDVPAPPVFEDKAVVIVVKDVAFADTKTTVDIDPTVFVDEAITIVIDPVEFTDEATQVLVGQISFSDVITVLTIDKITFDDVGIGVGTSAYISGLIGDTVARDATIASLGIPTPGPTVAAPTWFVSMASYINLTKVGADANIDYPVKTVRLMGDISGNPLTGLDADDKVIVIADHKALNADVAASLNDSRVQLIIVGHYLAVDISVANYEAASDSVKVDVDLLRAVTDKPLFLAVSVANFLDNTAFPPWAAEFGDIFDGYAVYNLVHFGAFEKNKREGIRLKLGLADKPMIVLDFVGGSFSDDEDLSRLGKQWSIKKEKFFSRLQSWGWRGLVVWSPSQASAEAKAAHVPEEMRFIP